VREIDREVEDDEDVKMAVIIKMPQEEDAQTRPQRPREYDSDEDDEMTGWAPGMEIGVWEGRIGSSTHRY
jgi:hypothetical protein